MDALADVHLYQANAEGDAAELAKEYTVKGYPTFVMLNSDRQTLARWIGYSKEMLLETMAAELADLSTIDEKLARYAENPALNDALSLARYSYSLYEYKNAVDYYNKAQELDPGSDYSYEILNNIIYGVRQDAFTYEDAVRAAEVVFSHDNIENQVYAAGRMSRLANRLEKTDEMTKYLERGIEAAGKTTDEEILRSATTIKIDYNLYVTGDKNKAIELKKSTYDEGWTEDPGRLNSFAWWCYVENVNLEEAEKLAIKAVELSEPGHEKAMILDTVANLCKAQGKMDDAIKYMEMAVAEDPDDEGFKETLEKFKEELPES